MTIERMLEILNEQIAHYRESESLFETPGNGVARVSGFTADKYEELKALYLAELAKETIEENT